MRKRGGGGGGGGGGASVVAKVRTDKEIKNVYDMNDVDTILEIL